MFQPFLNRIIDGSFGIFAVLVRLARRHAGQNFNAVVNRIDRPDMELSFLNGLQNVFPQHQRADIGSRNNNALVPSQAAMFAHVKETFDFFIGAADRLNLAKLVNRTGYGNILLNRNIGNGRQQAVIFG